MERVATDEVRINRLLWPAAGLSFLAGVIHWIVSPEYLSQWWGYGYFFIWAGLSQMVFGFAIFLLPWFAPSGARRATVMRTVYLVGAVGNTAIILLYIVTRTLGVPFIGPAANVILPVTARSVVATTSEVVLVLLLVTLARQSLPEPASPT